MTHPGYPTVLSTHDKNTEQIGMCCYSSFNVILSLLPTGKRVVLQVVVVADPVSELITGGCCGGPNK